MTCLDCTLCVNVQGDSLSQMTGALQSMDPLHTAYLDWRHLVRNLAAQAVPALFATTPDQLLQLKQRLHEADSNADGFLTESELMSLDVEALASATTVAEATPAVQGETASSAVAEAAADAVAAESQDDDEQGRLDHETANSFDDKLRSSDKSLDGKAITQLLFLMFASSADGSAAVDIGQVLLFLCSDHDASAGLRKAFTVLTDSHSPVQQVCFTSLYKTYLKRNWQSCLVVEFGICVWSTCRLGEA